jgi:hypothetical protein
METNFAKTVRTDGRTHGQTDSQLCIIICDTMHNITVK